VAVPRTAARCRARLTWAALDGERAVVPGTPPALPKPPLYDTASPAGQAIYITVDAGPTPSPRLLGIMRQAHVPVTAFLSEQAAQRNLVYWRGFMGAGGGVGGYTGSAPNLTNMTLSQRATPGGRARAGRGRAC